MNSHELFPSRGRAADSRLSSTSTRVHNSYSTFKSPHFVNNGALNVSATNTHNNLEGETHSYNNDTRAELRMLRKALNLPAVDLLPNSSNVASFSSNWLNQHGRSKSHVYLADSGYSSKMYPESIEAVQSGVASRNEPAVKSNSPCSAGYKTLNSLNCSTFYEQSLKSSLDESETKRMFLLEKLKEAHLTIQNQAEKLAESESELCFLRGQLKSMGIEQEGLQQDVDCLTMEKRTLEFFKSESLKNREEFLVRVNDLDKALKILTAAHNTLQTEAQKKEALLEKTTIYVTTLHEENSGLRKEMCSLRNIVDQQTSSKSDISEQLEQLNKDYQKILQDQAVVKHQLSESWKATQEAKSKQHKLNQEIVQLRMERDVQSGKVIVLEEEIQHQQQSFNNLATEHERLLKDKAEQDQRLQREINDRLCLKTVNDLLKEESAHVKEAFQKLEEFTCSMEQKSKDMNSDLDQCNKGNLSGNTKEASKFKELKTENESLKLSLNTISKRKEELGKQLKYQKEELDTLKDKLKELSSSATESHQRGSIPFLQEEVCKIKETVTRLESEKTELICEVSKLHKQQDVWVLQKSELEMTQAELLAENTQLRRELTAKLMAEVPDNNIAEIRKKFEEEKEEAVNKAKEDMKESFNEVCTELKTVKIELSKVWDMLEVKGKQVEEQCHALQQEQEQSQKWAEELMQLRKDYADLAAKTSSRSQMICTLRDELMQRCQEIIQLETSLSSAKQQKLSTIEASLLTGRYDGDINNWQSDESTGNCHNECHELKKLTAMNTQLNQRVKELMAERESALQDSQDLLNGMQQLREAFEQEMERELERERANFKRKKHLLQNSKSKEDDEELSAGVNSKLETKVTLLTAEKIALEVKSKHLECERDELRNQVEELCKMRTAAEEKAVQVDPALSPRKRENKTTIRKRSKSVGMMPPNMTIQEIPDSLSKQ